MKNQKQNIAIVAAIAIAIIAAASYKFLGNNSNSGKTIVANYKGGEVSLKQAQLELDKLIVQNPDLQGLNFSDLKIDQKEAIIKEIVLKEVAFKEAKKQNLNKGQDYADALRLFETELLKRQLYAKITADASEETNVKNSYDELSKDLATKQDIRLSYIALKNETKANSVHKIVTKYPNSFAGQAKKKSIDKEIAKNGGDLGFVLEDALPLEITEQSKKLEKGQISKPFALNEKWIIIKLEDLRPAQIAEFEDVKEALGQNLAAKALREFILKSVEEAKINITIQ
ncbi:MAG: peptidyl-prolyl cis-trans isomerase C [Lentimonas sp.]|jgi:peptidyl-prolyl cis-trans isomerase C